MKTVLIVLGALAALYLLNDLIQIMIAYVKRKSEIVEKAQRQVAGGSVRVPDYMKRRPEGNASPNGRTGSMETDGPKEKAGVPEETLRMAEGILERCGAVPTDLNERNRELLGQRTTYRYGDAYYRIDQAEFDGKSFVILGCADNERFADIGLMEDVEAMPPDLPEQEMEKILRGAMEAEDSVRE